MGLSVAHIIDPAKIKGFITNFHQPDGSSTTYDLRIGVIIVPTKENPFGYAKPTRDGRKKFDAPGETVELPPKGIAWLVSLEDIILPNNVTGHVNLVNALSRKGILAFNTGVIDPTYSGPVSTVIINFSSQSRNLTVGHRFFRITFSQHAAVQKTVVGLDRSKYVEQLIEESRSFPATFLDLESISKDTDEAIQNKLNEIIPKILSMFIWTIGFASLITALFAFFIHLLGGKS